MFGVFPGFTCLGRRAFDPVSLGTTINRLHLAPESATWQDSARSTPSSGTQVVGAWDDRSGNNRHAVQPTSGSRPTRLSSGGILTDGSTPTHLIAPAVGGWSGDFAIFMVWEAVAYSGNHGRYLDSGFDVGITLMQPDTATDGSVQKIKASVVDPGPPYGLLSTVGSLGTSLHWIEAGRIGTTHSLTIDGSADATRTISVSIADNQIGIGARGDTGTIGANARIREVLILSGASSQNLIDTRAYFAARIAGGVVYA